MRARPLYLFWHFDCSGFCSDHFGGRRRNAFLLAPSNEPRSPSQAVFNERLPADITRPSGALPLLQEEEEEEARSPISTCDILRYPLRSTPAIATQTIWQNLFLLFKDEIKLQHLIAAVGCCFDSQQQSPLSPLPLLLLPHRCIFPAGSLRPALRAHYAVNISECGSSRVERAELEPASYAGNRFRVIASSIISSLGRSSCDSCIWTPEHLRRRCCSTCRPPRVSPAVLSVHLLDPQTWI